MLIRVRQEHIDNGVRSEANCCPIALAVIEATGRPCDIGGANPNKCTFTDGENGVYALPTSAIEFYKLFDTTECDDPNCTYALCSSNNTIITPFEFELPID